MLLLDVGAAQWKSFISLRAYKYWSDIVFKSSGSLILSLRVYCGKEVERNGSFKLREGSTSTLLQFSSSALNTGVIGRRHFWRDSWVLWASFKTWNIRVSKLSFQMAAVRLRGFYSVGRYSLSVIIDSQFLLFQCPVISSFRLEVVSGSVVHLEPQLQPDTLRY